MSTKSSRGNGRRRSRRRPTADDRLYTLRLKPSVDMSLSDVISSGGTMVRDCRLQSIRLVGAGTSAFRVFLRGGFTNNEIISLATIPTQLGKLNRKLTMPRRVRNFFLDSHQSESPESYVILSSTAGPNVPFLDFVEFTFLRESPPILAIGQKNEVETTFASTDAGATKLLQHGQFLPDRVVYSFTYGGIQYLGITQYSGSNLNLNLISPGELQERYSSSNKLTLYIQ